MSHKEFKLDLAKVKHMKSDDHTTTLQHADGHTITLVHKALSKPNQQQLKALSAIGKDAQTSTQMREDKRDDGKVNMMAQGGQASKNDVNPADYAKYQQDEAKRHEKKDPTVKYMADGGSPLDTAMKLAPLAMMALKDGGEVSKDCSGGMVKMADGGDVEQMPVEDPSGSPQVSDHDKMLAGALEAAKEPDYVKTVREAGISNPLNLNEEDAPAAPTAQPEQQVADNSQMTPQEHPEGMPAAMPNQAGMGSGLPDMGTLAGQAYNQGKAGIQGMAGVQEQQGTQEKAAAQQAVDNDALAMSHYKGVTDTLDKERLAHIEDIKQGYVNPDKYWTGYTAANGDKVSGHSKIASAIGMILAGFNPTNNPNAAINMLKYQMDQSIAAQAKNLDSNHNLLRANLEQFHNAKDAQDMTRVMLADSLQHKLAVAAAGAKTAGAKAAAQNAMSQLDQQMIPIAQTLQMRQAMQSFAQNGGNPQAQEAMLRQIGMYNPEAYKQLAPRFVPGMGLAGTDVSAENRKTLLSHQQFDTAAQDLQHYMAQHGGAMDRLDPATRAVAAQKAMVLQALFREGTLGTVYREGEQPLLDKAVRGNPLSFAGYLTEGPKLQELRGANARGMNSLKTSLGGDLANQAKQSMQLEAQKHAAPQIAEGATGTYKGQPVVRKGGKWVPR